MHEWQKISEKTILNHQRIRVRDDEVRLPDGSPGNHIVIERPNFVLVAPKFRDLYYLVYQYRYPVGEWTWEFPMGGIDQDESPEDAAKRELAEETGFIGNIFPLAPYLWNSSSLSPQRFFPFFADVTAQGRPRREASEAGMTIRGQTMNELELMVGTQIKDARTIATLMLLRKFQENR